MGSPSYRDHKLEVVMGGELASDSYLVGTLSIGWDRKAVRVWSFFFWSCAHIPPLLVLGT